jgi:hypothetical protein
VVVLMETPKPSLGESLGSFVASLVDATLSHCEAHKGMAGGTGTQPGVISGKPVPDSIVLDPDDEVSWSVGVTLGCAPGSTGVPGETMVNLSVPASYPNGVSLGAPKMTSLPPGMAVPTSSCAATAPTHASPGVNTLRVSIDPALPRGLYLGELRAVAATTSGGPRPRS